MVSAWRGVILRCAKEHASFGSESSSTGAANSKGYELWRGMIELSGLSLHDGGKSSVGILRKCGEKSENFVDGTCPDVEFAFGWNRFNLRLIGLWPDRACGKSQVSAITRYSPPLWGGFVFTFIVAPQALAPIAYSFVLDELIQLVAGVAGIVGAIVKILVLWHNGEVLAWCLSFLTDDWTRELSSEERELMTTNARLGRSISIGFSVLMHCLVWSYFVLQALPLFYLDLDARNSTELGKLLLYPSCFPFDLSKRSNFAFAWIGQLLATFSSTIAYTASDCFVAMLVIHLCGQIAILRHTLATLLDNRKSYDREYFRENLANIVKRHETLIGLATVIEDTVNLMLLVLTLIYTVQFCLQLFGLMTAVLEREPGKSPFLQVIFFISYLNVTIIHLLLYCYVGDMLIEESEALGLASYSCKWYNLSGKEAKDLLLLMYRARAPLQISAGKFVAFSLELFGNVLKTSMSYFSVLLTMKEQLTE